MSGTKYGFQIRLILGMTSGKFLPKKKILIKFVYVIVPWLKKIQTALESANMPTRSFSIENTYGYIYRSL